MTQTLRMNYEFSRVYQKGQFASSRHVVLHYLRRPGKVNRLGVTASRKIKGSVRRNRIKRLLRESYRLQENQLTAGFDLVLVGRDSDDKPDFHLISREISRLFQKTGLQKAGLQKAGAQQEEPSGSPPKE